MKSKRSFVSSKEGHSKTPPFWEMYPILSKYFFVIVHQEFNQNGFSPPSIPKIYSTHGKEAYFLVRMLFLMAIDLPPQHCNVGSEKRIFANVNQIWKCTEVVVVSLPKSDSLCTFKDFFIPREIMWCIIRLLGQEFSEQIYESDMDFFPTNSTAICHANFHKH